MRMYALLVAASAVLLVPALYGAHAQTGAGGENAIYIFLQIEIRDESSRLAGYLETWAVTVLDYDALSAGLDRGGDAIDRRTVTLDGTEFEVFTGIGIQEYHAHSVLSQSTIQWADSPVTYAVHSGYAVHPGDKVTATWTLVREI